MGPFPSARRLFKGGKRVIPTPRSFRSPRRLPALFLVLGTLAAGFFFLQEWLVDLKFRPLVKAELSKVLQAPVQLRSIRVNLLGQVVLKDLSFTLPGSPWEVGVGMEKAEVDLMLFDLLLKRKPLDQCLDSLAFNHPRILLKRKEAPPSPQGPPAPGSLPEEAPKASLPPLPLIQKVSIRNGTFLVQAGQVPREILGKVHLRALAGKGNVWGLDLEARAPEGVRKGLVRFRGNFRPEEWKASGKLTLGDWPLVSAGLALKDLAGWTLEGGEISLESPVVFRGGRGWWFDAKAVVARASLRSPAPASIRFSHINGRVDLRPQALTFPGGISFQLGETTFTGTGSLPLDGRPLAVSATSDRFLLASLFSEVLKRPNLQVKGQGTAGAALSGTLTSPKVVGKLALGPSSVEGWEVDAFSARLSLQDGVLRLEEALGRLYEGRFSATGFLPLEGGDQAPVSLTAFLSGLEASKHPGLKGFHGKTNAEVRWGGTFEKPLLSAGVRMALSRGKDKEAPKVHLKGNLTLTEGRLGLQGTLNEKASLEGSAVRNGDLWEVRQFSYQSGRKTGRLTLSGAWPVRKELPVDLRASGSGLDLKDIPFLSENFPDVSGRFDLEGTYQGTRLEPRRTLRLSSQGLKLGSLQPEPMELSLVWVPGSLEFKRMTLGKLFSVTGILGLSAEGPLDLRMEAQKAPLGFLAGVLGWAEPPKPLEGTLTGKLHLSGARNNPILSGDDEILLESLQVGGFKSDRVEANLNLVEGRLQVRKLRFVQTGGTMEVMGSWDTKSRPGAMKLRFSAKDFGIGSGPLLSGEFVWGAQTKEPFWRNWTGTLSSPAFYLKDAKGRAYRFTDLSLPAESTEMVLTGRVRLGKALSGSAGLDLSQGAPKVKARLQIAPTLLSEVPEISQFLPPELKATGRVSGELTLKEGTLEELPLAGRFRVALGSLWDYKFDRLDLEFAGNKRKIEPILSIHQDQAEYSLSGSIESSKAFWDPDAKLSILGPVRNLKVSDLIALAGLDPKTHRTAGRVNGDLTVTGTLVAPSLGFSVTGEDLRFDDFQAPSAKLNFSFDKAAGIFKLEKNQVQLAQGSLSVEKGIAKIDPNDPTLLDFQVAGSTKGLSVAIFNVDSDIHLSGKLALQEKPGRPTLEGNIWFMDKGVVHQRAPGFWDYLAGFERLGKALDPITWIASIGKKDQNGRGAQEPPKAFEQAFAYKAGRFDFHRMPTKKPQLVGALDISQAKKIIFEDLHLENSPGSFSVNGTLDLTGQSKLESDAKDIPIEEIGKWVMRDFPLKGRGTYHLLFEGNLENPLLAASLSVSNGRIGKLDFDLLTGLLKSKDNTLFLGSKETPLELTKKGIFAFNLSGQLPLALTKTGWLKVKDREMDVLAEMSQGDFSLILLAGLAEEASGPMEFTARIAGPLDNPDLTLDLDLKSCRMVLPDRIILKSAEDIRGRIKVRKNRMVVEDVNAQIGQGRVFFSTPPLEESRMVLRNFLPTFLDVRMRTVGEHGVLLSIPTIMRRGEWGEVHFYGSTPEEPMLIRGPVAEPQVIGTAFLDTGRYTFPPFPEKSASGKNIEFKGLAGVVFDLKLASGKDTWYANEFNSQYLELKVDPGRVIHLQGKDKDKTPLAPGIKTSGEASSHQGFLRYLGSEFKLEEANLFIPKGKLPRMQGRGKQRLRDVEVVSAGGVRRTEMDIWVDFSGTFGNIDFKMDSSPKFSGDPDTHQKLLLSYIMFGRDMTGLSREELAAAYQQKFGEVIGDAFWDYLARISSSGATKLLRPLAQQLGNLDIAVKTDPGKIVGATGQQPVTDLVGNTLSGQSVTLVDLEVRKYIDALPKLSVVGRLGLTRDPGTQETGLGGQLGLGYDVAQGLSMEAAVGRRDDNQTEYRGGVRYSVPLPDIISPKKGDVRAPQFESFDVYPTGPGKFLVAWVTDEVTKSEVKVLDPEGKEVRVIPEQGQPKYRHEMVIDGLERDKDYRVKILIKDPNGNDAVREEKASSGVE